MCARCSKNDNTSYYVVMRDFGIRGLEAVTDPSMTRAGVIKAIKPGGEWDRIVFIHHIDDMIVTDVTAELMDEAAGEHHVEEMNRAERLAFRHDHERGLRTI